MELSPTAVVERLDALLVSLTSIRDGDSAARAVAQGALAGLGVVAAVIWRASDDGQELVSIGQHGLPPGSVEMVHHRLSVRQPLALVAEAYQAGQDMRATGPELRHRYPVTALLGDAGDPALPVGASALVLRSEGVPVGMLGLVAPFEPGQQLPDGLMEGVRSAVALWLGSRAQSHADPPASGGPLVTDRQRRLLELVAQGHSNRFIAHALGFSEGTVRADLTHLYKVLGAHSRSQLVDVARRSGLLAEGAVRIPAAGP